MSQLSDLLAKCEAWTADAAMAMHSLSVRRAALLKDAKRLKMVAACKAILVAPKMGGEEPAAGVAPEPYPSGQPATMVENVKNHSMHPEDYAPGDLPDEIGYQEGHLAIPKDIRR